MKANNVHILRVMQKGLPSFQDTDVTEIMCAYNNLNYIELEKTMKNVLHFIAENFTLSKVQQNHLHCIVNTLDIELDMVDIKNNYITLEVKQSIVFTHPALVMEWRIEKNKNLKPTFFSQYSSTNVWWKCNEGHEWQRPIRRRIGKNGLLQCPHCKQAKKSKNK